MPVHFPDADSLVDLQRFLERAERVGASSVRLQVIGQVLVSTVPVLTPRGLGDATPLILALRTQAIAASDAADTVVSIRSVLERIARAQSTGSSDLDWPPVTLNEAWAGVAPPQRGWERVAEPTMADLAARAEAALAPLASVTTTQPEALLTSALVADVHQDLGPAGVAAAAQSFGFLSSASNAVIAAAGRWSRLSTPNGHILWKR